MESRGYVAAFLSKKEGGPLARNKQSLPKPTEPPTRKLTHSPARGSHKVTVVNSSSNNNRI